MIEGFFKLCAQADLFSLLWAIIQNYRNRPIVGYAIAHRDIWITEELKKNGIKVWGLIFVGEELLFSARLAQAKYTQYWLERMGIHYRGGV